MNNEAVAQFYQSFFQSSWAETLAVPCPFCESRGFKAGRMSIVLKQDSFFYGYFRCHSRCVPGGYPLWFAQLAGINPNRVPGFDLDNTFDVQQYEYPVENINDEIQQYASRVSDEIYTFFQKGGIGKAVLTEMQVGFNGRYLVYPYLQEDGNCYSTRCVHPEKKEDFFWSGAAQFSSEPFDLYNVSELKHAEDGALFLCVGENNLLTLKQLGFPGVAVPHHSHLERLDGQRFARIKTLFLAIPHAPEALSSARTFASKVGFKVRILEWDASLPRGYTLFQLAQESGKQFGAKVAGLIRESRAFSPFRSPASEYSLFENNLDSQASSEYLNLSSGFEVFDDRLGGVHGLNVIGGAPKVGKSTFLIQIASEMARKKIPVLYYDFENGRQKIYQRTVSRLSRIATGDFDRQKKNTTLNKAQAELRAMMYYWRVINDRKVTPDLMRKHIDFIRHETRSEYKVVVIDSLHKLPFKDFSERRTGIDAWLRQMESMRDNLKVSFLVISELSRGQSGSYEEEPHLGIFKGSGDIEYSADNALVLFPLPPENGREGTNLNRCNRLWLVASRENSPGCLAEYRLDYPYWGFTEQALS